VSAAGRHLINAGGQDDACSSPLDDATGHDAITSLRRSNGMFGISTTAPCGPPRRARARMLEGRREEPRFA